MAAPTIYLDDPGGRWSAGVTIPTFYLYGEPHRRVEEGFVHVESIDDRSRPSEWTIRPHAHAELAHIFFIAAGGGAMRADAAVVHFASPCLLLVPATIVHGFEWTRETSGSVVTLAARRLGELAALDPALGGLFDRTGSVPLGADEAVRVQAVIDDLMRERGWSVVGHHAAVHVALLSLLVMALRSQAHAVAPPGPEQAHYRAIVARFRQRVEARFRLRESVGAHAAALGLGETALRTACARVAHLSPAAILDERALLEARRALLYSTLSVAEIGYSLGFADPAYFSRFFAKRMGAAPRHYREGLSAPQARSSGG